jgi:hypothetical protein
MNWINLFLCSVIAIGGFTASVYETIAYRMGIPVGLYFHRNGIITILGGFVTFVAIILSAFINPWWTIFIVFICGWFFSQLLISVFKISSQVISILLMVGGVIFLIINTVMK